MLNVYQKGELGEAVREERQALGMSQSELATLAGVSRKFVSELENGKETVEFNLALKVAGTLGVNLYFSPDRSNLGYYIEQHIPVNDSRVSPALVYNLKALRESLAGKEFKLSLLPPVSRFIIHLNYEVEKDGKGLPVVKMQNLTHKDIAEYAENYNFPNEDIKSFIKKQLQDIDIKEVLRVASCIAEQYQERKGLE
ncbi:MAG: helix-turn-helix transcriptional regulator [Methyloprofundus sp.]|nr:helix-turn-helix transcriptional regulator [Methyloprofundus sp.]